MFQMIDYGVEIKFQFVYVLVERGSEFNEADSVRLLAQLGKPSTNATTRANGSTPVGIFVYSMAR